MPYVFFAIPGSKAACPKRAACWSPPTPATGIEPPSRMWSRRRRRMRGLTLGRMDGGHAQRVERGRRPSVRSKMLYMSVREALVYVGGVNTAELVQEPRVDGAKH